MASVSPRTFSALSKIALSSSSKRLTALLIVVFPCALFDWVAAAFEAEAAGAPGTGDRQVLRARSSASRDGTVEVGAVDPVVVEGGGRSMGDELPDTMEGDAEEGAAGEAGEACTEV